MAKEIPGHGKVREIERRLARLVLEEVSSRWMVMCHSSCHVLHRNRCSGRKSPSPAGKEDFLTAYIRHAHLQEKRSMCIYVGNIADICCFHGALLEPFFGSDF